MEINDKFYEKVAIDMEIMGLHYYREKVDAIIKFLGP